MTYPDLIETERMTLRPLRPSDAGPILHYVGDARIAAQIPTLAHPYPPGAAEAFIARVTKGGGKEHAWALDASKIDGPEFIGCISLTEGTAPKLAYWVGPPFWNTGYATEAADAVVRAAEAGGATALTASIVTGNEASAHVLAHIGFKPSGQSEIFSIAENRMVPLTLFSLAFPRSQA